MLMSKAVILRASSVFLLTILTAAIMSASVVVFKIGRNRTSTAEGEPELLENEHVFSTSQRGSYPFTFNTIIYYLYYKSSQQSVNLMRPLQKKEARD